MRSALSERLKKERIEKNLTQQQLANLVNEQLELLYETDSLINNDIKNISDLKVSRVSISRYENGNREPELDILYALANVLHLQVEYLIGKTDFKYYDSQIMLDDILYLIEKTDENNNDFSKLIRNIVDTMYLTMHSYVNGNKIEELKIIHDLYRNIFDLKITSENNTLLNLLDAKELSEYQYTIKELKIKNINLFDKLCGLLSNQEK